MVRQASHSVLSTVVTPKVISRGKRETSDSYLGISINTACNPQPCEGSEKKGAGAVKMKVFILLLLVSALLQGVVCDVDIDIEYESAELSGGILDENISTTASTGESEQDPFDARQTNSEFLFRCNDESL